MGFDLGFTAGLSFARKRTVRGEFDCLTLSVAFSKAGRVSTSGGSSSRSDILSVLAFDGLMARVPIGTPLLHFRCSSPHHHSIFDSSQGPAGYPLMSFPNLSILPSFSVFVASALVKGETLARGCER
ncbi:hypothetical protein SCLCIDRAFT_19462 [Scleroderma citrinum Foug A]|uniref:Uncharacterized protein n=1 Tax=Scleroderma citrinum Foug A TaxID=1036808 RepID=A0A0C3EN96_9AGAM|nr:hypothetical protein SCLCIDRAFT_19462 [Scleroderma citrinum Foug A]